MPNRINELIVPVDGSENSVRAVRFALQLAASVDAGVRLLYVFPAASVELVGMAGMSREDIEHASRTSGERVLAEVQEALAGETMERMRFDTVMGDPAEEIISYADQREDVMVVIGRRGLSRIQTLLLGSVSDKVIRHARTPVTVVT